MCDITIMSLYQIKHSWRMWSAILSKCMDGARIGAYTKMIRVIRYVMDTRNTCLILEPNLDDENLDLIAYSDSDWVGNVENQISVTRFIVCCSNFLDVKGSEMGDTYKQ
jgi:hypothetical protein